jgi:hypothetical protein
LVGAEHQPKVIDGGTPTNGEISMDVLFISPLRGFYRFYSMSIYCHITPSGFKAIALIVQVVE